MAAFSENLNYMYSISGPILSGSFTTVKLFVIVLILSIPIGLCVTFLAINKNKVIQGFVFIYVWLMRGTPLLLQLFFFFYGLPFVPLIGQYLVFGRFQTAVVAFVLNYTAYFSEIFRGGLLSIDRGQYEAAQVLGFSKWQRTTRIIIPQMIKIVLPAVANESITLVKDTALVTAIGVVELLHYTKTTVNRDGNVSAFVIAAVFYLIMTLLLTKLYKWLEKKYAF